ncbi:MAG: alpha/beta hydrolase fold domain-containing protein [Pseudomonadales bacterium]|nr:alpha/beta hydrolase fold domain-containing protein [Pseudomonadales bacterium]
MALDPQAKALLESAEQSGAPPFNAYPAAEARAVYDQASELVRGNPPESHSIDAIVIPGPAGAIPAWVYKPSAEQNLPVLVYFHGGGYTIGSLKSHDCVCRGLCIEANCIVVSVDYRLAPENKYPAAVDDAWAAAQWAASNAESLGGNPNNVAIGGDSAGGNLTAVVSLLAKESGNPYFVFQLLIYPGTDMSCSFESHKTFGQGYRLTNELIDWFYDHYFSKDDDLSHWKASPLNAEDLSGLPSAFVLSAGYDPLQDENRAYAEKLTSAGVKVKHSHYEGMMHGFVTMPGVIDKAKTAISECAAELRQAFQN